MKKRLSGKPLLFVLLAVATLASCKKDPNPIPGPTPGPSSTQSIAFRKISIPSTTDLTDISVSGTAQVLLSGAYGLALTSSNAGVTWNQLQSPSNESFTACFQDGSGNRYVARKGFFRATASETTLQEVGSFSNAFGSIFGIHFFNSQNGLVIGKAGSVFRTTDGGQYWTSTQFNPGYFHGVQFLTNQLGFLYGGITYDQIDQGELYRTEDGGVTFAKTELPSNAQGLAFSNAQNGFFVGYPDVLYQTTDGGHNWQRLRNILSGNDFVTALAMDANQNLYATTTNGLLITSADAFVTHRVLYDAKGTVLTKVVCAADQMVWAIGNGGLLVNGRL